MKRIYVGNLPLDVRTRDLEDLFYKFGKIAFIDLKTRRGPPFAFVEFLDYRDAEEAVRCRDGKDFDGCRLRVEFPRGKERPSRFKNGSGFGGAHGDSSRGGSGRSSAPQRRSKYRVKVSGLPSSGSWQDLKDHMREVGEVCFADVFKGGEGVVEFVNFDDMRYAIRKLNNTKFKSHEGESSYIKLREDSGDSRSRSRSPISRRRGSPSYSPVTKRRGDSYSASRSRSRSRSPRHHKRSGGHHSDRHHHKKSRRARSDSRSKSDSRSRSHSRSPTGSPRSNRSSRGSSDRSRSRSKSHSRTPDSHRGDEHKRSPSPARSNRSRSGSRSPRHDRSSKTPDHTDRRSKSNSRTPSPHHDKSKSPARSETRRSATNSRTPSPELENKDD